MVGIDLDRFLSAFQLRAPVLQAFDDGQQLFIVYLVVALRLSDSAGVRFLL